jgi:pyridoxal 5'-phosphate synthase pdxT subunit
MGSSLPGRPLVGVLAVQGAFAEHGTALRDVGADAREVRLPAELEGLDGLVIPGGESTTFGLVAERSGLLAALREVVHGGLPVLGTCAGMVMLARDTVAGGQPLVGGMDVVVRRNAFGRQRSSFETRLAMPCVGEEPVPAVFIRAPWIESAGPGVEVLARLGERAVAVRQGRLLATAFHPELTGDRRVHRLFVDGLREAARRAVIEEGGLGVGAQ